MKNQQPDFLTAVSSPCKDVYTVESFGYLYEFCPHHPKANKWGYVQQHRLVVERRLQRFLESYEIVHHKDENKLNNSPDNLQVVTKAEHRAIHSKLEHDRKYPPITYQLVAEKLASGGLKAAARALGCDQETIRNNFPDLVAPYKRKSPAILDDPAWVDKLRCLASDENIGYREASKILGISAESVSHILKRNNIEWVRKTKVGEAHTKYVRKGQSYEDDHALVEQIRIFAADPQCSYDNASKAIDLSVSQIARIAKRNNIHWVAKSTGNYPRDD